MEEEKKSLKSELVETFLNLEQLDVNLYRAHHLLGGVSKATRVFGGQVIGQAMVAAANTVPKVFHPHSLHCYFIRPGDVNIPILYSVERVRDGRSFCTRYVKAVQTGIQIFAAEVSFHKAFWSAKWIEGKRLLTIYKTGREEAHSVEHSDHMDDVTPPEELQNELTAARELANDPSVPAGHRARLRALIAAARPQTYEARPVDPRAYFSLDTDKAPRMRVWVKANGTIGDDVRLHHCVAAYISDGFMTLTPLIAHRPQGFSVGMLLSLDHSIWIHRYRFKMDEWMLYETDSHIAVAGRSLVLGRLWTRDGQLVLSTAQEVLIRAKL